MSNAMEPVRQPVVNDAMRAAAERVLFEHANSGAFKPYSLPWDEVFRAMQEVRP